MDHKREHRTPPTSKGHGSRLTTTTTKGSHDKSNYGIKRIEKGPLRSRHQINNMVINISCCLLGALCICYCGNLENHLILVASNLF